MEKSFQSLIDNPMGLEKELVRSSELFRRVYKPRTQIYRLAKEAMPYIKEKVFQV